MQKLKMYYRWATNYFIARLISGSSYAPPPRILSIETTERCNLDCVMCPRHQTDLSKDEFTLEKFKHVLSVFPSINSVVLLGRGETFMMKDIFPILDYGSIKDIHFTIITNGMMLNEAAVKRIPDIGKIVVSIDHPHADEYRKIRRGGDLDLIISNLKELKKAKPQQWVCIQGLIMNSNIEYVEDFVRLAKEVSADSVKFIHPVIFDKAMNDIHIEPSEEINIKLNKARAYAAKAGIRFVAVPQMAKPRVCVEPWVGIRVSIKGYIYPCCYIDNSNGSSWKEWCRDVCLEIPQANYILGNVFDESARTIWNCEAFRLLRNRVVSSRSKKLIQVDRLNALRSKIDTSNRFSYCSVCLYRQNRSC